MFLLNIKTYFIKEENNDQELILFRNHLKLTSVNFSTIILPITCACKKKCMLVGWPVTTEIQVNVIS